ncbi:unnamed protein product, partial [Prorocentrum cordatum]
KRRAQALASNGQGPRLASQPPPPLERTRRDVREGDDAVAPEPAARRGQARDPAAAGGRRGCSAQGARGQAGRRPGARGGRAAGRRAPARAPRRRLRGLQEQQRLRRQRRPGAPAAGAAPAGRRGGDRPRRGHVGRRGAHRVPAGRSRRLCIHGVHAPAQHRGAGDVLLDRERQHSHDPSGDRFDN